jgi:hypothetical protein
MTTHGDPETAAMRLLYLLRFNAASYIPMLSILPSAIAILICGVSGAVFAWTIVDALGWTGIGGAIVTAVIGMVTATVLWAVGVSIGKVLRLHKK